jgi:hypothetical protein
MNKKQYAEINALYDATSLKTIITSFGLQLHAICMQAQRNELSHEEAENAISEAAITAIAHAHEQGEIKAKADRYQDDLNDDRSN